MCVVAAIFMNGRLLKHQDRWMDGIQDRISKAPTLCKIAFTDDFVLESISDMLSSIKGIRMAGLSELSYSAITSLRAGELDAALWFRLWLTGLVFIGEIYSTCCSIALLIFSSICTGIINSRSLFCSLPLICHEGHF